MAKARKILKRARAVENIRTMDMVSTARFKRAHDKASGARPYTDRITDLVGALMDRAQDEVGHPLLKDPVGLKRDVLVVLTSNRGMCGAMNPQVLRAAQARLRQLRGAGYEMLVYVVGKRGVRHFRFRGMTMDRELAELGDLPDYEAVCDVADELMDDFLADRISGVEVAFMQFVSSGHQTPVIAQILPMSNIEPPPRPGPAGGRPAPYDLIPAAGSILADLLPATVRLRLYQCFLDSSLSEQIMRIQAMRSATENADEMLHDLRVQYNRLRQSQITTELAEIVGGSTGPSGEDVPRRAAQQLWEGLDEQLGVVDVRVTSPVELGAEQRERICRTVQETFGREAKLTVEVDPSVLGGLMMRVGDRTFDATVLGKLAALRNQIASRGDPNVG
jgi:F-type H+-transporting ATPase subunit gamma